ncbi:hypothetical protein BXT86_02290 [candidate division WOR-3 bacterium 4484_100]|uniref:Hemolysin n=1 Tax=candidate division WOR-3 bacterium 4484_100 TaxID=1936077 RepID=A0A1V4QFV2_UNCW3|nr:MAG: hypothetical protein BXT86_02290 [candidate division WOR-3 bacterium 4484_100]
MFDTILYILLIFVFLGFSSFFSGMEAAIFSLSRFRVKALVSERRKGISYLEQIKTNAGRTLGSILLANLLVNIAASSVGAILLFKFIHLYNINTTLSFIIEFVIMTSLLLIIGEITPKTIAISRAETLALRFSRVIYYLSKLFSPVTSLMVKFTHGLFSLDIPSRQSVSDEELKLMLSEAKKFNILEPGEEEFGYSILKFGKKRVSEVMTPRPQVIGVSVDKNLDEVKKVISHWKHSRICVFDEKGDVVGLLYAKDLYIKGPSEKNLTLRDLMREPYIVPETKQLDSLLREFRRMGIHIAVVVDEFGNFSGIVTLEDILESLFGEVVDEYDELDELTDMPYKKFGPGKYVFDGDITIGELARILKIEPFYEEGERLAGFILNHLGRFPKEKEVIKVANIKLTIEDVHDRIIEKVLIQKD